MTSNGSRFYRSGGLLIESDFALDELAPPASKGRPDLRVLRAHAREVEAVVAAAQPVLSVGKTDEPWLTIHRTDNAFLARWPGQLDVVLPDDGATMRVFERGEVA